MHTKRFSVGLNLDPDIEKFRRFLDRFHMELASIYYSLPLGSAFYSRNEIEDEFAVPGSEEKLYRFLQLMDDYHIHKELALNINNLSSEQIRMAIDSIKISGIIPDEIVCLKEYGDQIKNAFPDIELKYSFNNTDYTHIPDCFDSVVVGKSFLRSMQARHRLLAAGFKVIVLLNNGCSFNCHAFCGDADCCMSYLQENLKHYTAVELYAIQSIFPFEYQRMLNEDPYASEYRFKLSTRPLGIDYTTSTMEAYLGIRDAKDLILADQTNYALFGVMHAFSHFCDEFGYDEIVRIKQNLPI